MAVAPLDKVRQVVAYGVTEIPPQKILMGLPNYGYDWLLPFEKGVTRATSIGNQYAVEIAAKTGRPSALMKQPKALTLNTGTCWAASTWCGLRMCAACRQNSS